MRICLILEGSYPYTHGGVSSWMHQFITAMPEHEFILWTIGAKAADRGKFFYELPGNVTEIHELFLDDALKVRAVRGQKFHLTPEQIQALSELMDCGRPDWEELFRLYQEQHMNPAGFLMSEAFLDILKQLCREKYPYVAFAETFHTIRSMLLPVLYLMGQEVPRADVYHTICTGYAGLLGVMGHFKTGKPLILSEHGIYSREREEEIIRAQWVAPSFKRQWIRFFYMLSDAVYSNAVRITCLFDKARETQVELGADPGKCRIIPNGILYDKFAAIPQKEENGWIDIAAVVRIAQIKDIKTMIYAFYELSSQMKNVRLHVLGGSDDDEYAQECYQLAEQLQLDRISFEGQVDVIKCMSQYDFTILTSISEGQPLSVLESFAAGRPCVTTDVGCCRQLLEGTTADHFGRAGYCVPPMHRESLAKAMMKMCADPEAMRQMGENGRQRVNAFYRHNVMVAGYEELYREVMALTSGKA